MMSRIKKGDTQGTDPYPVKDLVDVLKHVFQNLQRALVLPKISHNFLIYDVENFKIHVGI